ncbi:sensor histidine kinase [Aliterella atlantica]|uniref:histidine kinase n=1 Tax=Aliterella atlantica CENA595 TaxID=1618023 RepID=A0A0D9A136_9CYAN|nr:ATP-binding protein [Aliterella atlantica]KJH73176.1 hypothetical protein UH38_03760 [Aliterella atlantica CENA595]
MLRVLERSPLKNRLLAPLYTSFLLLVLLVIGQECLSILLKVQHRQVFDAIAHSLLVERETEHLLSTALDEQTTIRGYLFTRDREFLVAFKRAKIDFQQTFYRLRTLVQDNPTQLQQLEELQSIHDIWNSEFIQKVLNGDASKTTLPGKTLFDPMRKIVSNMLLHEDIILTRHKQRLSQLNHIDNVIDGLSILAILLGICFNLWLLRKKVEVPLRHLIEVGGAWQAGKMETPLKYSSTDEIGQLARNLNSMATEIRKRQVASLMRTKQLEDLISALSHDLRTPLLATRNTLKPMLNGAFGTVTDTWQEILEEYRQANEDLIELVEALVDVSRYEATGSENLHWEALDWEQIFAQAIARINAIYQQNCALASAIAPSLPIVYGDRLEIQRVIQNLLDNAVRVSPPNTEITLAVVPWHDRIKVSVCDRGSGIAPKDKERLFYRFMQGRGRRGRAGLGLYLCRQIVEAHGGVIDGENNFGRGSTFWFTLPVAQSLSCSTTRNVQEYK